MTRSRPFFTVLSVVVLILADRVEAQHSGFSNLPKPLPKAKETGTLSTVTPTTVQPTVPTSKTVESYSIPEPKEFTPAAPVIKPAPELVASGASTQTVTNAVSQINSWSVPATSTNLWKQPAPAANWGPQPPPVSWTSEPKTKW
jgi:hypothetical protein